MDLFFSDICNESVPQSDLDRGMAFRRGDRVVCVACDNAMSNEDEDGDGAAPPPAADESEQSDVQSPEPEGDAEESAKDPESPPVEAASSGMNPAMGHTQGGSVGAKSRGCLLFVLVGGLAAAATINAYLWVESDRRQLEVSDSIDLLSEADAASWKRFSDMQTSLSRQGQEKDTSMRESFETINGKIDEKFANLGNRIGRLENSLEGLRQSSAEDRRILEVGATEAKVAAGLAKSGVDSMKEDLDYLRDRVLALEEVLEGGLAGAGDGDSGGRQPSWYSQLTGLKDASAGNRWNAVTVLGDTGDPRVVPHLLPMLADEDVFVRMATARVLGDMGIPSAIPGLIDALSDGQPAVREAAVVALRVISGKDFRFDPLGKDADRRKAQTSWKKWWGDNSEDLLGG